MATGVDQAQRLLQAHRSLQSHPDSFARVRSPFSNRNSGFTYQEVNTVLAAVIEGDGPVEVVKALLAFGADVNFSRQRKSGTWNKLTLRQQHGQRSNILYRATVRSGSEIVRLLAARADQENLDSVLHHAIIRGDVDVLQALLDYGANPVHLHDDFQNAVFRNQDAIVNALLSGHRLPCLPCRSAGLRLAVKNKSLHITTLLLTRWADVNHDDAIALVSAVEISRVDLVAALLSGPVRPSPRSLDAALGKAYDLMSEKDTTTAREIIDMCLSLGASGPRTTSLTTDGVIEAVRRNHTHLLDTILHHRTLSDEYEGFALVEAVREEAVDALYKLLEFGPSSHNLTAAISQAMEVKDAELRYTMVDLLIKAGARGTCTAEALITSIQHIVRTLEGSKEAQISKYLFSLLLHEGEADVDYLDAEALQVAVKSCRLDLVQEIVSREPSAGSLGAALPWAMGLAGSNEKRDLIRTLLRDQICERAVGRVLVEAFKNGPGSLDLIETLLTKTSVNFNNGEVFIYAIRNFDLDAFSLLLGQGISYKALFTAVMEALRAPKATRAVIFGRLMDRLGLDHLNASLKHAVLDDDTDMQLIEHLLVAGADPTQQNGVCIKHAASGFRLDLVRLLSQASGKNKEAFSQALSSIVSRDRAWISFNHIDIIRHLLRYGASGEAVHQAMIEVVDQVACVPLLKEVGNTLLNLFFAAQGDVNYENGKAIGIAAGRGDPPLVAYLLRHGATSATAALALSAAIMAHHDEDLLLKIVGAFKKHPISRKDVDQLLPGTLNPILRCIKSYPNSVALIDALVGSGCSLQSTVLFQIYSNDTSGDGSRPRLSQEAEPLSILICSLMEEYSATSPAVLRVLIHHGGKLLSPDVSYMTPKTRTTALMLAAMSGRREIAQLLLKSGAPVSSKDTFGRSALFFAARAGDADMVALLLKSKPTTNDGSLHEASRGFHTRSMKLLIQAGHDPNHRSTMHEGRTALGELALNGVVPADTTGAEEALDILVDAGASPLLKVRGKTTIFLALDNQENEAMTRVLLDRVLSKTLHSQENTFQQGVYHYSPTTYVTKGILLGPQTETLAQMLWNYGAEDTFYADLGETQPADAVGLPSDIAEYERARQ
ncbi:Inversin, partial [Podospora aff. communis PSN243]